MAFLTNTDIIELCHQAAARLRRVDLADPVDRAVIAQVIRRLEDPDRSHDADASRFRRHAT